MVQFDEDQQQKRYSELRAQEEEDLVAMLAQSRYGVPFVDLTGHSIDTDALRLLEEKDARAYDVAPYKLIGKKVFLAVRSPVAEGALKAKRLLEGEGYEVTLVMASERSMQRVWGRYEDLSFATRSRAGGLDISPQLLTELSQKVKTIDDAVAEIQGALKDDDPTHHLSRLLEIVIGAGIGLDASDIHIEPMEETVELRFRLDGVLHVITTLTHEVYRQITTRLKLLSGLKLTISNTPQDGRFSAFLGSVGPQQTPSSMQESQEINFRTSLIPGAYGESIVLRILNPKAIHVQLEGLGISPPLLEIFMREIKKPNGLILLTGPTGSGKTTTLYAFLQKIYTPEINIITIEDPIEYHLPGITQTQTDHKKGYTFLAGLRSALRQDPDVIMVGEIRDAETAKIAIESALTGHLVFSTLHTNSASGVIPRLIDLEVNPKIMGSALTLSIAQRLVRTLCPNCNYERPVTEEERTLINTIWDEAVAKGKHMEAFGVTRDVTTLWGVKGCALCNQTGYKGRTGIFEAIETNETIEKIIPQNPSERDIKKLADAQGTLDMREDGLIKILQGKTDFAELKTVVDLYEK
ncbi:MAG TPA: GspE/PulE family protein [Candidatus Paceibacterota bacterium]|nr:GspE/PulE family protein [Candidatus Paceibacterota bacterium]